MTEHRLRVEHVDQPDAFKRWSWMPGYPYRAFHGFFIKDHGPQPDGDEISSKFWRDRSVASGWIREATDWCTDNFGPSGDRWKVDYNFSIIYIRDATDAVQIRLTYS